MRNPLEIVVIVAVIVLVFGPSRLPALGSSIGQMLRGFRKEMKAIGGRAVMQPIVTCASNTELWGRRLKFAMIPCSTPISDRVSEIRRLSGEVLPVEGFGYTSLVGFPSDTRRKKLVASRR